MRANGVAMHEGLPTMYSNYKLSQAVGKALLKKRWRLVVAESCTGGGLAAAITAVPGSSAYFDFGIVSYSNAAKTSLLGVPETMLATYGAVSEPVVAAMAIGALQRSDADISVAITGIAGPSGGSLEKPVGTVWLGWAHRKKALITECFQYNRGRSAIRQAAIVDALRGIIAILFA